MNLADLKTFVAVAETGSINRAAARLNLTQPAVTRRVQSFEAAIGTALLDRSSKPPTLTEAGRRALAYGRKALEAMEDLSWHTAEKDGPTGDFRLGVAPGFFDAALGAPLDTLIQRFPNISPRISSGWSGGLLEALRTNAFDAALVLLTEPQLVVHDLALRSFQPDDVVIIAARRTPTPMSPSVAEIGRHPWVLNPRGCAFRASLQAAIDRERGDLNICAEVQGYELQLSLVARGVGLGLVPAGRLKASPLRKALKVVAPHDFRLAVTPAVATPTRHARFASLVDVLAAEIERERTSLA